MKLNERIYEKGLVQLASEKGGKLIPLLGYTDYGSLFNPSILTLGDEILLSFRSANYNLYTINTSRYNGFDGKVNYSISNKMNYLDSDTYISFFDFNNLNLINLKKLEFIKDTNIPYSGLEDNRLINWNNIIYLSGTRWYPTPKLNSKICLSELNLENGKIVSSIKIPSNNVCEKNWMPILDRPFQWIKWTNPTELVLFDKINNKVITLNRNSNTKLNISGGTQLVYYKGIYIAIGHTKKIFSNIKGMMDYEYYAVLLVFDRELNLIYSSNEFKFLKGKVEFHSGLCRYKDKFIITFSCNDSNSYMLILDINSIFV